MHPTTTKEGRDPENQRRLPLAAGESSDDLDEVTAALTGAGVDFQVEERLADPERPGEWAWRILVLPDQLPAARRVIEALLRGGQATVPAETRSGASGPGPLYDLGGQDWLRSFLVLACLAGAVLLLVQSIR